jgi:hypothetical protein
VEYKEETLLENITIRNAPYVSKVKLLLGCAAA